jgi:predicted nucleotidyltransferase
MEEDAHMLRMEDICRILACHRDELRRRFGVCQIGVFGSYARGDVSPNSDLDILVELERPVGWEIVDLHESLESLLGVKVDLVTAGAARRKPLLWKSICEDIIYV